MKNMNNYYSWFFLHFLKRDDYFWIWLVTKMFGQTFQFVNALSECLIILPDECGQSLLYTNQSSPNKIINTY